MNIKSRLSQETSQLLVNVTLTCFKKEGVKENKSRLEC